MPAYVMANTSFLFTSSHLYTSVSLALHASSVRVVYQVRIFVPSSFLPPERATRQLRLLPASMRYKPGPFQSDMMRCEVIGPVEGSLVVSLSWKVLEMMLDRERAKALPEWFL